MKATFLGLGYVGLPTAAIASESGFEVLGVDTDKVKIKKLKEGSHNFQDREINKILSKSISSGRLKLSSKPKKSDIFFIVVPTPFKKNKKIDLSYVYTALNSIIPLLQSGNLIIIESTISLFTTNKILEVIYSKRPDLKNEIFLAYCPERILPGNTYNELIKNDRIIGGINNISSKKAANFYKRFVKGKIFITDPVTAEMSKLTENAFRDSQIAFANEISMICDEVGIKTHELISLANKHPRVNILNPGSGVGGHCIPVDPLFLISDFPNHTKFIKTARETNLSKTKWCIKKIKKEIKNFTKKNKIPPKVSLMGLSYKPNTDDLRESASAEISKDIIDFFCGQVFICEPNLKKHPTFKLTNIKNAYRKSDIVIWLVSHTEFFNLFNSDPKKIELDFCGLGN